MSLTSFSSSKIRRSSRPYNSNGSAEPRRKFRIPWHKHSLIAHRSRSSFHSLFILATSQFENLTFTAHDHDVPIPTPDVPPSHVLEHDIPISTPPVPPSHVFELSPTARWPLDAGGRATFPRLPSGAPDMHAFDSINTGTGIQADDMRVFTAAYCTLQRDFPREARQYKEEEERRAQALRKAAEASRPRRPPPSAMIPAAKEAAALRAPPTPGEPPPAELPSPRAPPWPGEQPLPPAELPPAELPSPAAPPPLREPVTPLSLPARRPTPSAPLGTLSPTSYFESYCHTASLDAAQLVSIPSCHRQPPTPSIPPHNVPPAPRCPRPRVARHTSGSSSRTAHLPRPPRIRFRTAHPRHPPRKAGFSCGVHHQRLMRLGGGTRSNAGT